MELLEILYGFINEYLINYYRINKYVFKLINKTLVSITESDYNFPIYYKSSIKHQTITHS